MYYVFVSQIFDKVRTKALSKKHLNVTVKLMDSVQCLLVVFPIEVIKNSNVGVLYMYKISTDGRDAVVLHSRVNHKWIPPKSNKIHSMNKSVGSFLFCHEPFWVVVFWMQMLFLHELRLLVGFLYNNFQIFMYCINNHQPPHSMQNVQQQHISLVTEYSLHSTHVCLLFEKSM